MRRLYLIIIYMCLTLVVGRVHAQYYSVNYDKQIVAAMAAAFGAGAMAESYYNEQVGEILKHYNAAEVATAGIFAAKFLERKAFTDLGIWSSSTENYYYRRIHNMVANKIMPKIWTVAGMMLKSPQTALYWGSYLMKICADTKSLCMQFESVVTNSSLTFADIQFLEINQEIAAILKLSEIGNVDWQQLLDDIASVPGNFTVENLTADIETLYNMGASLATAGINGASGALLQQSAFNDLFNGKVSKIIDIYDNYHDLYEQAENGIGSTLLSLVGGEDNVAALFDLSNYNITSWMTDYLSETQGNYYTQRWYIARRDQGSVSLCDYYPPTDDNSILNGDHWYRINTSDPNFYPNSTQREQILANSENHAGWSRSRVQQLNAQSDGFTYTMNYWMSSYIISRGGKQTKKAYAYEIHVTKSWNNVEEVYEDVFDSYSMDLNTFKRQLQARLSEYNDNEEGYVYYIGSDARRYYQATYARNFLYLGRGYNYPTALEGALKLKEISYIHAEGYPAAEMKHGPIALVDSEMPTVVIAPTDSLYDKIISNVRQVKARGGTVVAIITKGNDAMKDIADHCLEVPDVPECLTPLVVSVPLQLLAYYIAINKDRNVDQPRNLAKSVTVE